MNEVPGRPGALMLAELEIRDLTGFADYGTQVIPMLERWGGEVLAAAIPEPTPIEGEPTGRALVVHSWPSVNRFREFYNSEEYQPLKVLRHRASDSRLTAFPTLPVNWRP